MDIIHRFADVIIHRRLLGFLRLIPLEKAIEICGSIRIVFHSGGNRLWRPFSPIFRQPVSIDKGSSFNLIFAIGRIQGMSGIFVDHICSLALFRIRDTILKIIIPVIRPEFLWYIVLGGFCFLKYRRELSRFPT